MWIIFIPSRQPLTSVGLFCTELESNLKIITKYSFHAVLWQKWKTVNILLCLRLSVRRQKLYCKTQALKKWRCQRLLLFWNKMLWQSVQSWNYSMQLNAGQPVSAFVKVCICTCSKIEDDSSELSRIAHTMIIHFELIIVTSLYSITEISLAAIMLLQVLYYVYITVLCWLWSHYNKVLMIPESIVTFELKVIQFFFKCSTFAGDHNAMYTKTSLG